MTDIYVVIGATEYSAYQTNAPSYQQIHAAFLSAAGAPMAEYYRALSETEWFRRGEAVPFPPPDAATWGRLVGQPRVTRVADIMGLNETRVVAMYAFPRTPFTVENYHRMVDFQIRQLRGRLGPAGEGWGTIIAGNYTPAINGDIGWWERGEAANTATKDNFQPTGSTAAQDNPAGPTTAQTRPQALEDILRSLNPFDGVNDTLKKALWVGAALLGGYIVYQWAKPAPTPPARQLGGSAPKQLAAPRTNPTPRRRRRARR